MKLLIIKLFLRLFVFRKNKKIIHCPGGIGDTVFTFAFAEQIIEKYSKQKVIFEVKESHKDLLKLFHINDCLVNNTFNKLISYYCVNSDVYENQFLLYAGYSDRKTWWNLKGQYAVDDFYDSLLKLHGVRQIHYPKMDKYKISSTCLSYGVDNCSVILSPYAVSAVPINSVFWEKAVEMLIFDGYKVYTNVSKTQKELNHTIRLDASLYDMFYIASAAKCFIGYRSGICDYLAMSDTEMLVLYSKEWSAEKWDINGFSKRPVAGIIYEEDNESEILKYIRDYVNKELREK